MIIEDKETHYYVHIGIQDLEKFKKEFLKLVEDYYNRAKGPVMVDLDGLEKVDSSVLGIILSASRRAENAGSKLALLHVSDNIKEVLDITKLSARIGVFEDEISAHRGLRSR